MVRQNTDGINRDLASGIGKAVVLAVVGNETRDSPYGSPPHKRAAAAGLLSALSVLMRDGADDKEMTKFNYDMAVLIDGISPGLRLVASMRHDGVQEVRDEYGAPL